MPFLCIFYAICNIQDIKFNTLNWIHSPCHQLHQLVGKIATIAKETHCICFDFIMGFIKLYVR